MTGVSLHEISISSCDVSMNDSISKAQSELARLMHIIATLRSPEGCLWDRAQKREDVLRYIIDETYELVDAIEEGHTLHIKEELGDLLFQILFIARISEEAHEFDISDVMRDVADKMIQRHPHVFGNTKVSSIDDIKLNWQEIKKKNEKTPKTPSEMFFQGIPRSLPSLMRAQKVSDKAATVGFDWGNAQEVFQKVVEEVNELKTALEKGERDRIKGEIGDLLFTLVNLCRFVNVDAEDSLKTTIQKFIERFNHIEKRLTEQGKTLTDTTLEEMDALWEEAKTQEREENS